MVPKIAPSSAKMAPKPVAGILKKKKKTSSESAIKAKIPAVSADKPSGQKHSAANDDSKKKSVVKAKTLSIKVATSTEKGRPHTSKKNLPLKSEPKKPKILAKTREGDLKPKTAVAISPVHIRFLFSISFACFPSGCYVETW